VRYPPLRSVNSKSRRHRCEEGREDTHPRDTLPHLSACLAAGALVILVIFAINWLT
jgi:hypothetical protein